MTAREKFQKGDRVRLSEAGQEWLQWDVNRPKTGTVIGFSPNELKVVAIIRDGLRTRQAYHMDFWDKDES